MKTLYVYGWLLLAWLLLIACGGEDLPSDGPLVVAEDSVVGQTLLEETATPTLATPIVATAEAPATAVSAPVAQEPTAAAVVEETTTDNAVETELPTSLGVGESAVLMLAANTLGVFTFEGTQFEPLLFFAEATADLDISLQIYGETVESAPLREANFSGNGRPETMVFSPQTTGTFHVAVQAVAGAGESQVHVFAAGVADVAFSQADSLVAGQQKMYEVVSNNGRPVLAYVDPAEQVDLQISIAAADGSLVADANFGGKGSAEASFVLPLETTAYTITISEVNGAGAAYDIVIVTLD